jgi:predicted site-specific integrase-resolvase
MNLNDWMTAREVAEYAGINYPNLWTYRKRGILPMPDMYVGNKPLWSKSLIESWDFQNQKVELVDDPSVTLSVTSSND